MLLSDLMPLGPCSWTRCVLPFFICHYSCSAVHRGFCNPPQEKEKDKEKKEKKEKKKKKEKGRSLAGGEGEEVDVDAQGKEAGGGGGEGLGRRLTVPDQPSYHDGLDNRGGGAGSRGDYEVHPLNMEDERRGRYGPESKRAYHEDVGGPGPAYDEGYSGGRGRGCAGLVQGEGGVYKMPSFSTLGLWLFGYIPEALACSSLGCK